MGGHGGALLIPLRILHLLRWFGRTDSGRISRMNDYSVVQVIFQNLEVYHSKVQIILVCDSLEDYDL